MTGATKTESIQTRTVVSYPKIQRACNVFGLTHTADGGICLFRENLARDLSSSVNVAVRVLGGSGPLRVAGRGHQCDMDAKSVLTQVAGCRQLADYPDLVFVPAVDFLIHKGLGNEILIIKHQLSSAPVGNVTHLNQWLEGCYEEGCLQGSVEKSRAWQSSAEDSWAGLQSILEIVFSSKKNIFACKADLLNQGSMPKDGTRVDELWARILDGRSIPHMDVAQLQAAQRAFHETLMKASPLGEYVLGWIYAISYSRISGPYITAILLCEEDKAVPVEVSGILKTVWSAVMGEDGYLFYWPSEKCQWTGRIGSEDEIKRGKFLLGLECVALTEMYVRPRCLINQETFVSGNVDALNKDNGHENA